MKSSHWQFMGDVNWSGYGGTWFREVSPGAWQFIELTNMDEACGRDNEGHETYVVELSLVDLSQIGEREIASVRKSCDIASDASMAELAWGCHSYGCKAPLESWSGNGYSKLLREARKLAHELRRDANELADRMDRPVNKIGSTASEYMKGDVYSAVLRGLASGDPAAELMLKMGVKP